MSIRIFFTLTAVAVLLSPVLRSQTPAAVTVPQKVAAPASIESPLKFLQEMKAANDATLKTQAAQLATLDDLQKAAEEIKVYAKRG